MSRRAAPEPQPTGTEIIVIDFETYYDKEYTLSNHEMTMESYIRGSRFQPLVFSFCRYKQLESGVWSAQGPTEIEKWIKARDWSRTVVIAQNAAFDCGILAMRYGVFPKFIVDTMSMARGVRGPGKSASLAALAAHYELPEKTVPYGKFLGKKWEDLSEPEFSPPLPVSGARQTTLLDALVAGCEQDVVLTHEICRRLLEGYPKKELAVIDMTIRMFTEPQFVGDEKELYALAESEHARKQNALVELGVTEAELQSTSKFVTLLEAAGEEVPTKTGKLGPIPCVAKSDPYIQELSSSNGRAGRLAQARLDVRSTLAENRAYRLGGAASRGAIPVALNYCGAATTRWSGADKVNWQNFPGVRVDPTLALRKALKAPPGKKVVSVDASQIEYRILCAFAGQEDQLQALREKRDIYSEFGTLLYGRTITKADKVERAFSKRPVLGCGYGMGAPRFLSACEAAGVSCTAEFASRAVKLYRETHPRIESFWGSCETVLRHLFDNERRAVLGPAIIRKGFVDLPNGLSCPFELRWDQESRSWVRKTRYGETRYWGGGMTEFLCQSHARVHLSDVMLRAKKELGIRPAMMCHDSLEYIVPEEMAESVKDWVVNWMSETPKWFPGLPLAAEGWIGDSYGQGN